MISRTGSSDDRPGEASPALRHELPAHFVCDGLGRIQSWNVDAERIVGIPAAAVVGKRVGEVLVRCDHQVPVDVADLSTSSVLVQLRDSQPCRMFLQTSLALSGASDPGAFVVLLWPAAASTALGTLPEAVSSIATRIGHDLWQMLSPVLGNTLLLEDESSNPLQRARLGSIRQSTEAVRTFAQRLMALDPKRKPTLESCDLGSVVRAVLPSVCGLLRGQVVLVDSIAAVDGVRANHRQIEQLLVQLVSNAQDAMPGPGEIVVQVDAFDSNGARVPAGRWARLQVRDNGPGIEPALLAHVFEPFVSTKVPASGAGLGLPIVAATVHQHGGMVEVESRLGEGTIVSLFFSRHSDEKSTLHRTTVATPPSGAPVSLGSILLVEDNPMVRRSVESSLRSMGYHVTAVGNGEQCLQVLRTKPGLALDLLITDVVMPEMSGKELIERVHELRPTLPVLFMSGYDRSTLASRRQPLAAEHFLQKPFDSQDLSQAVETAIAAGKGEGSAKGGSAQKE